MASMCGEWRYVVAGSTTCHARRTYSARESVGVAGREGESVLVGRSEPSENANGAVGEGANQRGNVGCGLFLEPVLVSNPEGESSKGLEIRGGEIVDEAT